MARYIDADKTIEIINSEIEQCKLELDDEDEEEEAYTRAVNARLLGLITCLAIIKSQPTADVIEVVHAEWLDRVPYIWSDDHMTMTGNGEGCSVCKWVNKGGVEKYFKYCPNCGAKMDKELEK